MYSDTRTAYGRIVLHNEHLGLDDTLAGYDTLGKEMPLITPKGLLDLPERKQNHTYIRSILLSQAANCNAFEQWSPDKSITVVGNKLTGEKSTAALSNGYLLKSRRAPGLVLQGPNEEDPYDPRTLLRLDSLFEYDEPFNTGTVKQHIGVKSDAVTDDRVHAIILGFLHLRKALGEGRYGLIFMSPADHREDTRRLRRECRPYGIPVFDRSMTETVAQFDDAAADICNRLPQLKEMTFKGKELQPLRLVSGI